MNLSRSVIFKILVIGVFSILLPKEILAQNDSLRSKQHALAYTYGGLYVSSMVGLNQLWYKDYPASHFHFFDDNQLWLLMDKVGHGFSVYTLTKYTSKSYQWAGIDSKKSALYGAITSMTFLTTIEIFDGFSSGWGFSWGDMAANTSGALIYLGQEELWGEQKIKLKFSYAPSDYREKRTDLLGDNSLEGLFKDYNAQTYWATLNLNSICSTIRPKWLNVAVGYSGNGMVNAKGAYQAADGSKIVPYRQYFLSLDVDLEKIKVKKRWLRSVLSVLNVIKIPLPTVEFREGQKTQFHLFYF